MRLNPTQNGRKNCTGAIICYQMNGSMQTSLQIDSLLLSLDSQQTKDFRTTHAQHSDTDLISEPSTYTMYLSQKIYSLIVQMAIQQR